jgi:hypothetical protein
VSKFPWYDRNAGRTLNGSVLSSAHCQKKRGEGKSGEPARKKRRKARRAQRRALDSRFFKFGEGDSRNFVVLVSLLPKPSFASSKVFLSGRPGSLPWAPCFFEGHSFPLEVWGHLTRTLPCLMHPHWNKNAALPDASTLEQERCPA